MWNLELIHFLNQRNEWNNTEYMYLFHIKLVNWLMFSIECWICPVQVFRSSSYYGSLETLC